jgi:phosphatidylglycerophosphatase C
MCIMKQNSAIVAYFDFDGTLTTKDTLVPFLIHCVGWPRFLLNLPRILPWAILYLSRIINNEVTKQKTLTILLKGRTFYDIDKSAKSFAYAKLSKYIQPEIFAKLEYHKEHRHQVILVSANLAIYLRYWATMHKLDEVIGTEIEFINNIATGNLATSNCYGEHKVIRINEYLGESHLSFNYSYAYGNSKGDYELLDYVNEGYWVEDGEFRRWESRS